MFSKIYTAVLVAMTMATGSFASPVAEPETDVALNSITVHRGTGSMCGTQTLTSSTTRCFALGGNSISSVGNCQVITWSGADCHGSSQNIPTTGACIQVPYAGIQVIC